MKFRYLLGSIALVLAALNAECQLQAPARKPHLVNQLPARISCSASSLENLFTTPVNNSLSVTVGPSMKIEGLVVAKAMISPEQLSVNILCSNFKDAQLNISRIRERDGSFSFIGKMVSPKQDDVLLLWQEHGQYAFIRQQQLLSMVE